MTITVDVESGLNRQSRNNDIIDDDASSLFIPTAPELTEVPEVTVSRVQSATTLNNVPISASSNSPRAVTSNPSNDSLADTPVARGSPPNPGTNLTRILDPGSEENRKSRRKWIFLDEVKKPYPALACSDIPGSTTSKTYKIIQHIVVLAVIQCAWNSLYYTWFTNRIQKIITVANQTYSQWPTIMSKHGGDNHITAPFSEGSRQYTWSRKLINGMDLYNGLHNGHDKSVPYDDDIKTLVMDFVHLIVLYLLPIILFMVMYRGLKVSYWKALFVFYFPALICGTINLWLWIDFPDTIGLPYLKWIIFAVESITMYLYFTFYGSPRIKPWMKGVFWVVYVPLFYIILTPYFCEYVFFNFWKLCTPNIFYSILYRGVVFHVIHAIYMMPLKLIIPYIWELSGPANYPSASIILAAPSVIIELYFFVFLDATTNKIEFWTGSLIGIYIHHYFRYTLKNQLCLMLTVINRISNFFKKDVMNPDILKQRATEDVLTSVINEQIILTYVARIVAGSFVYNMTVVDLKSLNSGNHILFTWGIGLFISIFTDFIFLRILDYKSYYYLNRLISLWDNHNIFFSIIVLCGVNLSLQSLATQFDYANIVDNYTVTSVPAYGYLYRSVL